MRNLLRLTACLVLSGLSVAACGNTANKDSGAGDPISAQMVERMCAVYQPCCAAAGYYNEPTRCQWLFSEARVTSEAAAEECIAAIEKQATGTDWCQTWFDRAQPAECDNVFVAPPRTGHAKVGEACESDNDCDTDLRGSTACNADGTAQVCKVLISKQVGESCMGEYTANGGYSTSLVDGLNEVWLCEAGLSCNQGKCVTPLPLGATCSVSSECESKNCEDGACGPASVGGFDDGIVTAFVCGPLEGDEDNASAAP
ncbi:MAG: hypothetical protein R3B07_08275 [Polyangiaceae bacterium]